MKETDNDYERQNESKRKSHRRKSGKSAKYNMTEKRAERSEIRRVNAKRDGGKQCRQGNQ
jgi:hypothetical protein